MRKCVLIFSEKITAASSITGRCLSISRRRLPGSSSTVGSSVNRSGSSGTDFPSGLANGKRSTSGWPTNSTGNFGHAFGIPLLLERENGKHQVDVPGDGVHAALPPRPELRRHIADDFRLPIPERTATGLVVTDGPGETQVKAGIVDQHDGIRLAAGGEVKQLTEKSAGTYRSF